MNPNRATILFIAACGLAGFASAATGPVAADPAVAAASWAEIKDLPYDSREQFSAGLKLLETQADEQVSELVAQRTAMKSSANTKDWDFAMKEMVNARAYLKSTGEEVPKATPETWTQQKDKVGLALVRTDEAYAKVKASTTT